MSEQDGLLAFLTAQPLLALAMLALLVWLGGWLVRAALPRGAGLLQGAGYFLIAAALLLTIADAVRSTDRSEAALALTQRPSLQLRGGTTRIPIGRDGHFWVEAAIDGTTDRFLIDTGATITGLSQDSATQMGVVADPGKTPLEFDTANGPITARVATVARLTFGNIDVRDLEVTILPSGSGAINVIGMNLLAQLASWRVEGKTLILVPRKAVTPPR